MCKFQQNIVILSVFLVLSSCASFNREGVYIDKAKNLSYFSIGSHNIQSVGNRTDLDLGVPIEGIPVDVKIGGNGFLTSRNVHIKEIEDIKYYELASRNQDIQNIDEIIEVIPTEFYMYDQTIGN